jgi:membrane protein
MAETVERVEGPTDLTVRAWWQALRDAAKRFRERDLLDNAAALTYYSVLSLFPFLIVLVSLLGVLGSQGSIDSLLRIVEDLGSGSAVDTLRGPIENIVESSSGAGVALVLGIAAGLWSASGYIGAFMRSANHIYGVDEDRPFYKLRPIQLLMTLVMTVIVAVVLTALVLTGPLVDAIGAELGVGDTAVTVFEIVKWPLLFAIVVLVIALLYRFSPNAQHAGLRWILPGSLLATVLWIVASVGFSLYVANLGSYGNTYGSLAGVIVFLIWVWLTNAAILFGAQFGAELERTGRAAAHATPPGGFAPFVSAERGADEPGDDNYSASAAPAGAVSRSDSAPAELDERTVERRE